MASKSGKQSSGSPAKAKPSAKAKPKAKRSAKKAKPKAKPKAAAKAKPAASVEPPAAVKARPEQGKVLVTGISGNLGRLLARNLHRVARVVGVDRRPFRHKPKDVEMVTVDLRRRATEQIFRDHRIDAVVHLNILHDPRVGAY